MTDDATNPDVPEDVAEIIRVQKCPTCDASKGQKCTTLDGQPMVTLVHLMRRRWASWR